MKRGFISDNCAGAHPIVLRAVAAASEGHAPSYGADDYCAKAKEAFAALFERSFPIEFVFNGTGANLLALACMLRPFEAVVCADCAHINGDETGAPERVLGSKLLAVPSKDGRLTPADILPLLSAQGNQHHSQPRVLSITNVTEWGAVYTPDEVRALTDFAHAHGLFVHMDGARIANAVAAVGCTMADMTWKAGLDALSFGGVKNGLLFGEAVVFFNETLAENAPFARKNIGQLQSKLRFIGAQYTALLEDNLWLRNATHANAMGKGLETVVSAFPQITLLHRAAANMIFCNMPRAWADAVCSQGFGAELSGVVRMVASWDTEEADIEALSECLRSL